MSARPLPVPINPALLQHADERRQHLENRIADTITRFAGSMLFVYLHIIWFAAWIILGVEHYPYGLLTMIVSLEAIFLSTFVMISQNRADEKRQVLADHQWKTVQEEEQQNEELLQLSNQILELTKAIHALNTARSSTGPANPPITWPLRLQPRTMTDPGNAQAVQPQHRTTPHHIIDANRRKQTVMTTPESGAPTGAMTITEHELAQSERANATGRQPVVFVHGLWLLPSSWDRWAAVDSPSCRA